MIDSVFKDKLMTALTAAVAVYNEGNTPTDSVVKSAKQHKLNIDQTERLVETFNTARTLNHFNKYARTDDKMKEFELADKAAVTLALFDKAEEKKANPSDIALYSDYIGAPKNYNKDLALDFELPPVLKAADFVDTDMDTQIQKAHRYSNSIKQVVKESHANADMALTKADMELSKLANMLKQGYEEDCKDKTARLYLSYSSDAAYHPILEKLAEKLPAYVISTAQELKKYGSVIDNRDLTAYQTIIKEAQDLVHTAVALRANGNELMKQLEGFHGEFNKAAELNNSDDSIVKAADLIVNSITEDGLPDEEAGPMDSFFNKEAASSFSRDQLEAEKVDLMRDKLRLDEADSTLRALNTDRDFDYQVRRDADKLRSEQDQLKYRKEHDLSLFTADQAKLEQSQKFQEAQLALRKKELAKPKSKPSLSELFNEAAVKGISQSGMERAMMGLDDLYSSNIKDQNKKISNRLKNIHRSTILQDLIISDPIISDTDPETVAKAYSAIIQIAPEMSLNKEVVRAVLRQTVHAAAISPFDAAQWAQLEKTIKEISGDLKSPRPAERP